MTWKREKELWRREAGCACWCLFQRVEQKEGIREIAGTKIHYESAILYPKSNSFGISAFTFLDYEKAEQKFIDLNNHIKLP